MIAELKSNLKVVVDVVSTQQDYIYVVLDSIEWDGDKFSARLRYETRVYVGQNYTASLLTQQTYEFPKALADTHEGNLNVQGNLVSERLPSLIQKGVIYRIDQDTLFGLTSSDYQVL